MLGVDNYNGTAPQVAAFRDATGATYPLLLNGTSTTGGNVEALYGLWDNYIVIDMRDTTVVYHAQLLWPHGNRYHLDEIRAAVDGILATVDAGTPVVQSVFLRVSPNPVHDRLLVEFALPPARAGEARFSVFDAAGRARARFTTGAGSEGRGRWEGSLRAVLGDVPRPGVYYLRLESGGEPLLRRFVVLPE